MAKNKKVPPQKCKAVVFADYDSFNTQGEKGAICFEVRDKFIATKCPGCGTISALPINDPDALCSWNWDGNKEQPTLSPSVYHIDSYCGWHGFLRKGEWVSV